jgi:hypothetical protein
MINSAAFPNVALSPPRPAPSREASASVVRPMQVAGGTIGTADVKKMAV